MPISNLVECAVNLAEKVTGVDIDRDGDVGQRTSNESGAVTSSTVRSFVAVEDVAASTTTDLTTGIADWKMDDGSSAPVAVGGNVTNGVWYVPTGNGKWLGNSTTGEANKVYGYTLSFEVNSPPFSSF